MMDFLLLVGGALFAMFVSGIVNYRKSVWVGLNWDDLPEDHVGDKAFLQGAKWAEAKLREKNT